MRWDTCPTHRHTWTTKNRFVYSSVQPTGKQRVLEERNFTGTTRSRIRPRPILISCGKGLAERDNCFIWRREWSSTFVKVLLWGRHLTLLLRFSVKWKVRNFSHVVNTRDEEVDSPVSSWCWWFGLYQIFLIFASLLDRFLPHFLGAPSLTMCWWIFAVVAGNPVPGEAQGIFRWDLWFWNY